MQLSHDHPLLTDEALAEWNGGVTALCAALTAGPVLRHVAGRRQFRDETLESVEIARHAFQDEVGFSGNRPAFAHGLPLRDARAEGGEFRLGLLVELDENEENDGQVERARVDERAIAGYHASVLERAYAAQAGRRGDADAPRQLYVGHAAVRLQRRQNGEIDRVEAPNQVLSPNSKGAKV